MASFHWTPRKVDALFTAFQENMVIDADMKRATAERADLELPERVATAIAELRLSVPEFDSRALGNDFASVVGLPSHPAFNA